MKALILAGGRGSRLEDWTDNKNKSMIKLYEKPLIEYNLDHAVEAGVSEIVIVVCYKKDEIIKSIGNEYRGTKITYVEISEEKIKEGLVTGIEAAREAIDGSDFILMLADEIISDAKLREMIKKFKKEELFAVCGIVFEKDKSSISKTYTAMGNHLGRVFRLIEKPRVIVNNIKGTGHCILKNDIFNYIERTPINAFRKQKELVDLIQVAIDDGKKIHVYPISKKGYVNVNTKEDFELAKDLIKKENPKVLIVHTQMKYFGGAELLITELANQLTKRGIKNDILALSKSKEVENLLINTDIIIPKHNIDLQPPGFKSIKEILSFIRIYRREIKKLIRNYDVINFHDFPATWTLWPRKKPAVWFMNLPPNLYSKPNAGLFLKILNEIRIGVDKFMIRNSMDIITVAESLNKIRAKERYGMNSRLIDFGVDYNFFSSGDSLNAKKKYGLEKKFVILQSGMITEVKNQLESIKTIEKLKDKIPNILLILSGRETPDYKKKIDDYIKEKKLEKYIKFIGMFDNRKELADLYKASDVGLFPLKKMGGVLAPIEVLCAGVPIIVSEEIETASLIKEKDLGIVTSNYADSVLEIYNNKKEWERKAKEKAVFIQKNLSWEMFAEKMIRAYKDAWKNYS